MTTTYHRAGGVAGVTLGYLLHALAAEQHYDYVSAEALPDATVYVADRAAILTFTATPAPALRAAAQSYAAELRCDVALVRILAPERDLVRLSIDLTLAGAPCRPWSMNDLQIWTGRAGDTWLVPDIFGPAVSLTDDGFNLELLPPFDTTAERYEGVLRAAADIASFLPMAEAN